MLKLTYIVIDIESRHYVVVYRITNGIIKSKSFYAYEHCDEFCEHLKSKGFTHHAAKLLIGTAVR